MHDTVRCPYCRHSFFHEGLETLKCPKCNSNFSSSEPPSERLRLVTLGNTLIAFAVLQIVVNVIYILITIYLADTHNKADEAFGEPTDAQRFVYVVQAGLAFLFAPIIWVGGLQTRKAQNYWLALTSCLLCMLPAGTCCILGLFIGAYGLTVIHHPKVKPHFG